MLAETVETELPSTKIVTLIGVLSRFSSAAQPTIFVQSTLSKVPTKFGFCAEIGTAQKPTSRIATTTRKQFFMNFFSVSSLYSIRPRVVGLEQRKWPANKCIFPGVRSVSEIILGWAFENHIAEA